MNLNLTPKTARFAAVGFLLIVAQTVCGAEIKSPAPQPAAQFRKQILTDQYYSDGITAADINRDGKMDIVAGPCWYEGPGFTNKHEFYPAKIIPTEPSPTDSMFSFVYDFNGDGWPDILVLGRVHLHQAFWYENPQGKPGLWKKHFAFERIKGESPPFQDVDGDGKPELVAHDGTRWGLIQPDWKNPADPWRFKPITVEGKFEQFYHGEGIGDVNGDGRLDLILNEAWHEQPAARNAEWIRHEFKFGEKGGAQMFAMDVDGDGDNDIISAIDAHGWGLAWFEQVKEGGIISFKKHVIMGTRAEEKKYGVAFSQPHALALADVDGDGLQDIIVGKRRWAHGPKGDIEPMAEPVLYWFKLVRDAAGAHFEPHLIDRESGVGVQVTAADVNGDGHADVLTVSKLGAFVFLNQAKATQASATPQRLTILGKTRVYDAPADYASFPGIVRGDKALAIGFTIQPLDELKASGLHPHYAPVIQYRYARSADNGKTWSVTSNAVSVGKVANATRFMHSASAAMSDGSVLTCFVDYERGTKTRKPSQFQIRRGKLGDAPDITWAAGPAFTNLAPFAMIRLADGTFLLSAQKIPDKPRGCVILKGSADGREWQRLSFLPPVGEISSSETEMAAWPDGRVIAVIRAEWFDTPKDRLPPEAHGNGTKRDGYGYFLYQATSSDSGKTWSEPTQLPIWGHPPALIQLRSGNLLMVYGHRRPPFSVRAILSHDRGVSWDLDSMVELHRFEPGNYDMGYPVATELDNGEILVAYYGYATRDTSLNSSHAIFCTRIVEQAGHNPKPASAAAQPTAFPGQEWDMATPESQGVDDAKLKAAVALLEKTIGKDGVHELAIIRNGRMIWHGDDIDKVHGIWSFTKVFTSASLGLLIDDGKCTLDTKAKDILPAMAATYPKVTLRHFATMTSGYRAVGDETGSYKHGASETPFDPNPKPLFTPPGSHFAYWDSAMNQFANALTHIAGEPLEELFKRRIADPIGMNRANWRWGNWGKIDGLSVNGGSGNKGGPMKISAREAARLGLLFLNRGNWNGKQLISEQWVAEATRVQVPATLPHGFDEHTISGPGEYGFNWWINGIKPDGKRKFPGAPPNTYCGAGHNNNYCFVIPEWNMVICRLGLDGSAKDQVWSDFLAKVGAALKK